MTIFNAKTFLQTETPNGEKALVILVSRRNNSEGCPLQKTSPQPSNTFSFGHKS